MNEVLILPKQASAHSATNGALKQYQEKLAHKYLDIVGDLRNRAQESSVVTNNALQERMARYNTEKERIIAEQRRILESMGTTSTSFNELQNELKSLGDKLFDEADELKEDSLKIYDQAFKSLQPYVDESFDKCSDYVTQLPQNMAVSLESVVSRLNKDYLTTKQALTKVLFQIEADAQVINENADKEFEQRTDEWRVNRFNTLIEEAKTKLDPSNKIDFEPILQKFYTDQQKFTLCIKKVVQNVTLIGPPQQFKEIDLENWWKEAEDIMELHANFINTFLKQIQEKVDARNDENSEIISKLETELVELKDETESGNAIAELLPLFKQSRKLSAIFIEKLTKYWTNRSDAIKKSFEAIRDFIKPLIEIYNKFINDINENNQNVLDKRSELLKTSTNLLDDLEVQLAQKTNEIQLLVAEKDINMRVATCKQILEKIENEYRQYYEKSVAILNEQPTIVMTKFEQIESGFLELMKMKKTSSSEEWTLSSARTNRSQVNSSRKKSAKRPQAARGRKKSAKDKADEIISFSFELENGSKFEESEPFEIIPQLEEFIDEAANQGSSRTQKSRGRPPLPRAKRARGAVRGQRGARGGPVNPKADTEMDDIEVPEFVLMETVPKINDEPSILVYTPENVELNEWKNSFRKLVIESFQNLFEKEINKSNYNDEKQDLADELNERMRTHAPRANSIELNVAQTRTLQVETRKIQLEKHFRKAAIVFNKGLKIVENSIEKRSQQLKDESEMLHSFVERLPLQKASDGFDLLKQEFTIATKKLTKNFEEQMAAQHKEIEDFINGFNSSNERFMESISSGTETFSEDEREMCNKFFERMNAEVTQIVNALHEKEATLQSEVEQVQKGHEDEFELNLPHHRTDIKLIESLAALQTEGKSKYDSLLFKNKQSEMEVNMMIAKVDEVRQLELESQEKIKKEFETLDAMRVGIIKRAKYLNMLKSAISPDAIPFTLVLSAEIGEQDLMASDSGTNQPSGREKRSRSRQSKSRPERSRSSNSKKSQIEQAKDEGTLEGQIDAIGAEILQKSNPLMVEYYNQLKTRKFNITRPEQIPLTLVECVERVKAQWKQTCSSSKAVIEECSYKLKNQVAQSSEKAEDIINDIYGFFTQFYSVLIESKRQELQIQFEEKMLESTNKRNAHRTSLTPTIVDENNKKDFLKMVKSEDKRRQSELKSITEFNESALEVENKTMKTYIAHLPVLSKIALQMLDNFPLPEDLKGEAKLENATRLTMREMLKEKERRLANTTNDPRRPFYNRQWPQLSVIMKPMASIPVPESKEVATPSSKKKRRRSDKSSDKSDTSTGDKTPLLSSLETSLHRNAIIQQNQSYADYEGALVQRIDKLKYYINTLNQENQDFETHWRQCISSMKPDFNFEEALAPKEVTTEKKHHHKKSPTK